MTKVTVEKGVDFLLKHFEEPLFPRTISTRKSENRQFLVHSKDETLGHFEDSNFEDCRISAFSTNDIELARPNLIFIDLDDKSYLESTLGIIMRELNGVPTILSTGRGLALIQPIQMKPWKDLEWDKMKGEQIAGIFLRYSERLFSGYKCDTGNHPSLKSCLIRVPGSINTKSGNCVSINGIWNNKRPDVHHLPFRQYLEELFKRRTQCKQKNFKDGNISYIEHLLRHPINEGRKRIFALILCPYLVNLKKLSLEEAETILSEYFKNYIPISMIRNKLKEVLRKGILPYGLKNMQENDPELFLFVTSSCKNLIDNNG